MNLSQVNGNIKIILGIMALYMEKDVKKGILLALPALKRNNPNFNDMNLSDDDIVLLYESDVSEVILYLIDRLKSKGVI